MNYGSRNPSQTLADVDPEEREHLRDCYRTAFCRRCGTVWFRGNTGFPCTGCGDGRYTPNYEPTSESAFNGQIEAKCERLDEKKPGSELKRKILGDG